MWKWLRGKFERRREAERARRAAMWRELGGRPPSLHLPILPYRGVFLDFRESSSDEMKLERKNRSRN